MSKNVAVFVDVANIFYAAKAAGVDIDYVTLLKSATAGRDFVRAYAYTGLDPDNDNQRQFHQFLARHDYKVVSKDIRKYGDGKVKANLDIELVVDLMKTARNLDIAVVVSGDGDFAPAIRAVQEMGVRVEVISFRGNTSSDLIEVADLFTDITQLARVEKESSRSGRRVASEDDLSMTAVPDKESEGAPRRRRTARPRAADAEEPVVAAEPARGRRRREPVREPIVEAADAGLIALPGERLSRAATQPAAAARPPADTDGHEPEVVVGEPVADAGDHEDAEGDGTGRRRRRRRGGRGRGRGRGERPIGGERPVAGERPVGATADDVEEAEEEAPEYAPPRAPQPSTFGSIWDSQLGVPSTPVLAGEELDQEPDDEPEIPEYLLAERRQRGGYVPPSGMNRGSRGRSGTYQAALDRERFGRAAAPSGGGGSFGGPNRVGRAPVGRGPRPDRGSRPDRGARPEASRSDRPVRPYNDAPRPSADAAPWSEVPPELEAQLRAELARRPVSEPVASRAPSPVVEAPSVETPSAEAKPRRTPRRSAAADAPTASTVGATAEAKPRRARAPRAATAASAAVDSGPAAEAVSGAKPKRPRVPRKTAAAPDA